MNGENATLSARTSLDTPSAGCLTVKQCTVVISKTPIINNDVIAIMVGDITFFLCEHEKIFSLERFRLRIFREFRVAPPSDAREVGDD